MVSAGQPEQADARSLAPTDDERKGLLDQIVARLMKLLTRRGCLVEEQGMAYRLETDADQPLATLQAAFALGPRAG